ncbi:hypothetical protein Tsubulata_033118 [Turnera subulata]|uniref:Ribosome-inactivating protein n=1 Tax=Turnera subulata TaxID=218843 RepID=A0A9Q0FBY7_9ROSI|nr:hypothetical protein Tsubulata_033118 [Turnera subulata]
MKLWSVVAAGAWVCLILVVELLGCSGAVRVDPYSSTGSEYPAANKYSLKIFPTVEFNLDSRAPVRRYTDFILKIRSLLNSGIINGIASMPASVLTGLARYGLLRINVASTQQFVVIVVIELNDLYVVGFHCNNVYHYLRFSETNPDGYADSERLFDATTTTFRLLPYDGNYGAGGRKVGLSRQRLIDALTIILNNPVDVYQLRPSFMVVAQMISEAARSGYVMKFVTDNYVLDKGAKATEEVKAVENGWSTMSKTVRKTKGNILPNHIVLIAGKWEVEKKMKCGVVVVVAWVCWILVVGADPPKRKPDDKQVNFTVDYDSTTAETYTEFIIQVRSLVSDGVGDWGIDRMPQAATLTGNRRLGLLRLENHEGNAITLVIRLTDLYVVGFHSNNSRVENFLYYFNDLEAEGNDSARLLGARPQRLGYESRYTTGLTGREDVRLGRVPLINAITTLYHRNGATGNWRNSLIVLVQMISEAARSNFMLDELAITLDKGDRGQGLPPDRLMMNAETCWDALSQALLNAQPNGDLKKDDKERIENRLNTLLEQGQKLEVNTVLDILAFGFLALVKVSTTNYSPQHRSRRSIAACATYDMPIAIMQQQEYSRNLNWVNEEEEEEEEEEITTNISGPNGLCLDVFGGKYHNGAELILWTCKSNNRHNQLWTFKKDGTIRSNNNWCLNPSSDSPSENTYIMIYECPQDPSGTRAVWELLQDGTLRNTRTGLVLTAKSYKQGAGVLTVDYDDKMLGQGWVASNYNLKPILTRVQWLPGRCLNVDSASNVVIGHCEGLIQENKWAIHWHRSITNIGRNGACLAYVPRYHPSIEGPVIVEECSASSRYQRWEITGDGGIKNTGTKLFLTVTKDEDGGNCEDGETTLIYFGTFEDFSMKSHKARPGVCF